MPDYRILKNLNDDNRFRVYSIANRIIDKRCFKNINFLTLNHSRTFFNIRIPQEPVYNYSIYKTYKKVENEVNIIHHCGSFQYQTGYNLIPLLSNIEDKAFLIGPMEIPHLIFENDFLADSRRVRRIFNKLFYVTNRQCFSKLFNILFEKTIKNADRIIVPNKEVKDKVTNYIDKNKVKVISYGVDLSIFKKFSYKADKNNYSIVYAGSAIERKGVEYLLKAVALVKKQFPKIRLYIRSNGYKLDEYKRMAKKLNIYNNIIFLERKLGKEDFLRLVSKSRLLCLPTLSEGYGWTILEAMCLGVPVVTTNKCGCNELFENGSIGLRVKPKDENALAEGIIELFNDFELCRKFSENGLRKREKFDYEKIIPKYIKLYEEYI